MPYFSFIFIVSSCNFASNEFSNSNSHYLCSSDDHFVEPSELGATEMTSLSVGLSTFWACLVMIDKTFPYWSFFAMLQDTLCFTCS